MKHKEIFDKAYNRLTELYGDTPDIQIISRFYSEKVFLQERKYIRYLDLFGRISERASALGEHIRLNGTAGSSFIAYLLGATKINPLPFHEYCPKCNQLRFTGEYTPLDRYPPECNCGSDMICDGYGLPFEMNLRSVFRENIQLGVSRHFFNEAKAMICEYMSDRSIVTLTGDEDISLTWLCFPDRDKNNDTVYPLKGNAPRFGSTPHITLAPIPMLDKYRELENATGVKMKDHPDDTGVFSGFFEGEIDGLPYIGSDFMKELIKKTKPEPYQGYNEILKLIGLAHGTNVWKGNADKLFEYHIWSMQDIPAFADDIYEMICQKLREQGIYDVGFAYEVALKTRQGYYARNGLDSAVSQRLLDLGFTNDFCGFISKINYMFPKAQAISFLKDDISVMWYKIYYPEEYSRLF